jgi:hypothetical protein
VVATYGRGFWVLDDITPLRTLSTQVTGTPLHLFPPRNAYRFRTPEPHFVKGEDPAAGFNPPDGTPIDFWLKQSASDTSKRTAANASPKRAAGDTTKRSAADSSQRSAADSGKSDSVTITISDASGATVRTLHAAAKGGMTRMWWDLRGERTPEAKLRTSPQYAPWVKIPAEGQTAPGVGRVSTLVPPGTYTVTLAYKGAQEKQPLVVLKDPASGGSDEEIKAQMELVRALTTDIDTAVTTINRLELIRSQLGGIKTVLSGDDKAADVRKQSDSLDAKLAAIEAKLFQTRVTGRGQDLIRWPMRVTEQLLYLQQSLTGSDTRPTQPQQQVSQLLHTELMAVKSEADQAVAKDVAAFNDLLQGRKYQGIITSAPEEKAHP